MMLAVIIGFVACFRKRHGWGNKAETVITVAGKVCLKIYYLGRN